MIDRIGLQSLIRKWMMNRDTRNIFRTEGIFRIILGDKLIENHLEEIVEIDQEIGEVIREILESKEITEIKGEITITKVRVDLMRGRILLNCINKMRKCKVKISSNQNNQSSLIHHPKD